MRRRRLLALQLLVLPALAIGASGEQGEWKEPEDGENWELRKESDGVRVFTRDSSLPGLKTVRAETVIPVDDPYVIVALLDDVEATAELMDKVSFVEQLESEEPGTKHVHMVLDVPWPLKDRDIVAALTPLHDEEGQRLILTLTGNPGLIPVDRKYVRVPNFNSSYTLHYGLDGGVHVTLESTIDPGGSIPDGARGHGLLSRLTVW
jgi:hypothetical protein